MRIHILLYLVLFIFGCQPKSTETASAIKGEKVDLNLYEVQDVQGSNIKRVVRSDNMGNLIEEGFVENGVKIGTWTNYYRDGGTMKTLASYLNGQLNGTYLEMDRFSRLTSRSSYKDGLLHGKGAKYKMNRATEEYEYANGKLEGQYRRYFEKNGELQMEATYKNGELDGKMTQFNTDGGVVISYQYKNGKQID